VPHSSESSPWLASQRRSRARRFAAHRSRLRRWKLRSACGVLVASLALAGGALAQGTGNGGAAPATRVSVKAIQHALGIPADGIAGPQTRRALKRFQREHGLKADGIAGPATLRALGLAGQPQPSRLQSVDPANELAKIAACESGGNPAAVSADGRYRGKYQFTRATWQSLGGTGDPAAADEATQDAMAAKLYAQRGSAPWPACG
jgi:hypothetical protein